MTLSPQTAQALLDTLQSENARLEASLEQAVADKSFFARCYENEKSENACLREQVKELREGLRPFARMASDIHEAAPDNALCVVATLNGGIMSNKEFCTVSDLRRARDLMEKTNGEKP